MSVSELERVKQDLATIREAAGLELPFGRDSVWVNLIGLPCLGAGCLAYWLSTDNPSRYAPLVATALLLLLLGALRFRYRASTGRSATERREYGSQFYGTLFLCVVAGSFLVWAELAGIDIIYIGSGLTTCLGMMITLNGLTNKAYRAALGGGIPCILFGISMAVWPSPGAVLLNATLLLFVAGPAMATIQIYQLKQLETAR